MNLSPSTILPSALPQQLPLTVSHSPGDLARTRELNLARIFILNIQLSDHFFHFYSHVLWQFDSRTFTLVSPPKSNTKDTQPFCRLVRKRGPLWVMQTHARAHGMGHGLDFGPCSAPVQWAVLCSAQTSQVHMKILF